MAMLFFRRHEPKQIAQAPAVVDTPVSTLVLAPPTRATDEEYQALAQSLGVEHILSDDHSQRRTDQFQTFLAGLGVRQYNIEEVRQFLNGQYGLVPWGWRPLRKPDWSEGRDAVWLDSGGDIHFGVNSRWAHYSPEKHGGLIIGSYDKTLYSKPVPYPVLLRVKEVSTEFPDAKFFISDEMKKLPIPKDPFLLVQYNGHNYIIERWDEPSFRG